MLEQVGQAVYEKLLPWVKSLTTEHYYREEDLLDWEAIAEMPGWVIVHHDLRMEQADELIGFVGYLDLETTGLLADSHVICAAGVGSIGQDQVIVIYNGCGKSVLPIRDCVVANWNQPFDRQFYQMDEAGLIDLNWHIDLMGLQMMVRGKPEGWSIAGNYEKEWVQYIVTDNSLATAAKRVGIDLDKTVRSQLIAGDENLTYEQVLRYCYRDAVTTEKVGQVVLREYLALAPNPLSLYGHMLRHRFILPISKKWDGYYDRAEAWYQSELTRLDGLVSQRAIDCCVADDVFARCIRENWPEVYRIGKGKLAPTIANHPLYPSVADRITGYPYQFAWKPIKYGSALFSLLLGLSWFEEPDNPEDQGRPILFDRGRKIWYCAATDDLDELVFVNREDEKKRLASLICKAYEDELDSGKIAATGSEEARKILKNTQRWKMFRKRVADVRIRKSAHGNYLVPCYSPSGTLTGRATDKLTLLIGSPKQEYGGSEFMSMIEARPGYKIVQMDLDAGELVLAGLFSVMANDLRSELDDPLARANLTGSKSKLSDVVSLVSIAMGIDRKYSKGTVYGGIYGQGRKGRIAKLQSFGLSRETAELASDKFQAEFIEGLASGYFWATKMMTELNMPTMLLGRNLPLAYRYAGKDGMTSRWNHNVQSLGEDWLCCLMAFIEYYMGGFDGDCNLILTRHDELVFHVKEDKVKQLAIASQQAHYQIRRELMYQFGVSVDPPRQWMTFQGIEIHSRYKKSYESDPSTCTTQFED